MINCVKYHIENLDNSFIILILLKFIYLLGCINVGDGICWWQVRCHQVNSLPYSSKFDIRKVYKGYYFQWFRPILFLDLQMWLDDQSESETRIKADNHPRQTPKIIPTTIGIVLS